MPSDAIPVRYGTSTFLVEVDPDVKVPVLVGPAKGGVKGIPKGMEPVSDVRAIGREFADIKDLIVTVCRGLHETIAAIPAPEAMEVEFGIKLGGEAGLPMITKASAEASFQVKIGWAPGKHPSTEGAG
jgi:hypothetical protein